MIDLSLPTNPDIGRYLDDASGHTGRAEKAFAPSDLSELRSIVQHCATQKVPLTISGAGTGLTGARVPEGGWVVSLERFRKLEIRAGEAICGPGVLLSELAHAAAAKKQFLGPNPTEYSAALGGTVSTNAGGARSFRYGAMRRQVLYLEVTFMTGQTARYGRGDKLDISYQPVRIPNTTKNSAGYYLRPDMDWIDLLAGSEGTLAIVSEIGLKLQPEPGAVLSGVVFLDDDEKAVSAVEEWRGVPELRLLEYMDGAALDFLRPHYAEIPAHSKAALLIEQNLASQEDEEVDRWADRLLQAGADENASWFGFSAADHERFREFRHTLPVIVVDQARRNGFPKYGTDFAVPLERGREAHYYFRGECQRRLPGKFTIFGHAGDANNHINLLPATKEDAEVASKLIDDFARYVVELNGTIAAEHGIGKNKRDLLQIMYSPEDIQSMRAVKTQLDPDWLLGRGNIFRP